MCCLHKTTLESVKKTQDFKRVYSQGKYAADALFVVYALANNLPHNRLGVTVSKKVGNAVARNRIKRWVKECYRQKTAEPFSGGQAYDIIFVARTPVGQLDGKSAYSNVNESVKNLLIRVGRKLGVAT